MSIKITAYKCRYCGKIFESQTKADKHEVVCRKSITAFSCLDCLYSIKKKVKTKLGEYERVVGCKFGTKISVDNFIMCKNKKIINI